jgi:hypothetical protein
VIYFRRAKANSYKDVLIGSIDHRKEVVMVNNVLMFVQEVLKTAIGFTTLVYSIIKIRTIKDKQKADKPGNRIR